MSWLFLLISAVSTQTAEWRLLSGNQTANAVSVCGAQGIFSHSNIAPSLYEAGFFAADGVVHLVGGYPTNSFSYWEYNLTQGLWRCRNAPDLRRYSFQWAYNSSIRRLYVYSGIDASNQWPAAQSNFLTVNSTLGVKADTILISLHSGAMALVNQSLYFFGGSLSLVLPFNTAAFMRRIDFANGLIQLTPVSSFPSPSSRTKHGMLFHQRSNSIYLYGGMNYNYWDIIVRGDFWKYDIATLAWSLLHPEADRNNFYPGARFSFGFAISQLRDQIFISGGSNGMELPYNDIWTYYIADDRFQMIGGTIDEGFLPAIITGLNARPNGTVGQKLAFDETTQRLFQWDGYSTEGNSSFNRIWEIITFNATFSTTTGTATFSATTFCTTAARSASSTPVNSGTISFRTTSTAPVTSGITTSGTASVGAASTTSAPLYITTSSDSTSAYSTFSVETNLLVTTKHDGVNHKTTAPSESTSETSESSISSANSTSARRGTPVVTGTGDNSLGLLLALIAAAVVLVFVPTTIAIHYYRARRKLKKQVARPASTLLLARTTTEDVGKTEMTLTRFAGMASTATTAMTTTMTGSTLFNTTQADMAVPAFLAIPVTDFKRAKQIAKGGSGTVFLAEGLSLDLKPYGTIIAKQIIDAPISILHQEISGAFFQEIAIMYLLREQRNIAKFLRYCVEPVVLLMKFYELGSLKKYLRSNILNKAVSVSLLSDIARGLNALHFNGIAHCDIKTDNVLLDRVKGKIVAVLTDFGISRVVEAKVLTVNEFKTSNMKALTFSYAAPEVIAAYRQRTLISSPAVVKSGDIYSFGSIGYVILAKKEPWNMN